MSSYLAAHGLNWYEVAKIERIERQEGMINFIDVIAYTIDTNGNLVYLKSWIEDIR